MFELRFAAVLLLATAASGVSAALDLEAVLREADASRHAIDEGEVRVQASVVEEDRSPARSVLDVYVRGAEELLCVFREGTLAGRRILVAGSRTWLLLPDVARPIPVDGGQRLLGGASIADLARLRFSDFDARLERRVELDGTPCLELSLTARDPHAQYASATLWVGERDHLPRRARLALRSGREAKELRFLEYDAGPRPVLRRLEIRHLLKTERAATTTLEFLEYRARSLPPNLFEPAGARAFE